MTAKIDIDGQALAAECPQELNAAARDLLEKLRALHAHGPTLHPGSIIEFGWAPLRIDSAGQEWQVCEPDFANGAKRFVPGVGVTLRVLDDQARIVRLTGATPHPTRFDQIVLVADAAWTAPKVFCDRGKSEVAGDSGWYVGSDEDGQPRPDAGAKSIMAGELAVRRPEWAAVMILPPGYLAAFERGRLTAIYDDKSRPVAAFPQGNRGG